MLLPEEEEYNKAKKEFDHYMEIAKRLLDKAKLEDNWGRAGYDSQSNIIERYLREVILPIVPARNIIEEITLDVKTILGDKPTSAPPNFMSQLKKIIMQTFFPYLLDSASKQANVQKNVEKIESESDSDNSINESTDEGIDRTNEEQFFHFDQLRPILYESLQKLIAASEKLDKVYETKLGNQPSGKVIYKTTQVTSVRDDYRQNSWKSVSRICLDGIQNHLPHDSLGTKCHIEFFVGDKWVDAETAKAHRDEIKEVRFVDNGTGYYYDSLLFLGSDKEHEDESVGQFGEGLKLICMAALNMGLGIELQSRNWRAIAKGKPITTINTRNSDTVEERNALAYDIEVYDGEPIVGSRTIFHTPTKEFIDYALDLPSKVVELSGKKVLSREKEADIIDSEEGGIAFVKGVYLCDFNSLLQYDFKHAEVNPNRNSFVDLGKIQDAVASTLAETESIDAIKILLKGLLRCKNEHVKFGEEPFEYFLGTKFVPPKCNYSLWRRAFQEACLEMGYIKEGQEPVLSDKDKRRDGFDEVVIPESCKVVNVPDAWKNLLKTVGVRSELDVIPEYVTKVLHTHIGMDSVDITEWDRERILLEVLQNHLPSDSGGSKVFVRFKTKSGLWQDYTKLSEFPDENIDEIKVCDDGDGYDYGCLGVIVSLKKDSQAGRFGEGSKRTAIACTRLGERIGFRSRKWIAEPDTEDKVLNEGEVNERTVQLLTFNVRNDITKEAKSIDDGDGKYFQLSRETKGYLKSSDKSATYFYHPSPELIKQFRELGEKVLYFSNYRPITEVDNREVIDTQRGRLFVRGLLIPGNHGIKFSYHLKNFVITNRDRNSVKRDTLSKEIMQIFENTTDEAFIAQVYSAAILAVQQGDYQQFLEFVSKLDIKSYTPQADAWIKVFKEMFKGDVGIRKASDDDFNAVHRAQHLGIRLITLPDNMYKALKELRGRNGEQIPSYDSALNEAIKNAIPVDDSMLTERELAAVNQLLEFNKLMKLTGYSTIKKIQVFDYKNDYFGNRAAGYHIRGDEDKIYISRETLNSGLFYMAHVFFHEATHLFTNAEDADKAFRNCLSEFLGKTSSILFGADESLEKLAEMLAKNPESVAILNNMIENLTQLSTLVKKKTDMQGQGNTTEEVAEEEGQTTPPEDGKTDSSNPEDGKNGGTEVTME